MDRFLLKLLGLAVVLLLYLQMCSSKDDSNLCPDGCFCNKISNMVYCSRRGMQRIPSEKIPSKTVQLNLNGNIFQSTVIKKSNFSRFALLEHLYMSECGIEKIEVDTFSDMNHLQWLDFSNNRIKLIEEYTFSGLSLMHLFLNGNRNIKFRRHSFSGLKTTGLYLHECSLTKLDYEVFMFLNGTLKNLWLNGNEFTKINKRFQEPFSYLQHLRLGSNPFHCNCEMQWFKQFYDSHLGTFEGADPPSCLSPPKYKGKFINNMAASDFACQAPVFKNIDAVFKGSHGMLRCTASGDPSPRLFWIQPSALTTTYKPPSNESVHFNQAVLNISAEQAKNSDLSGSYFCVAVNEAGNMTFTFNVTWPTVSGDSHYLPANGKDRQATYKTIPANIDLSNIGEYDVEGEEIGVNPETRTDPDIFKSIADFLSTKSPLLTEEEDYDSSNNKNPDLDKTGKSSNNNIKDNDGKSPSSSNTNSINTKPSDNKLSTNTTLEKTGDRLYTLAELIGAIIGTFILTVLICGILFLIFFLRKRRKHNSSPQHLNSHHRHMSSNMNIGNSLGRSSSGSGLKPAVHEVRFLNGNGSHTAQTYDFRDYYDTPGSLKR